MTKKNRTLLLMLGVLVLVCVLCFGGYQLLKQPAEPRQETEEVSVPVFAANEEDLERMMVTSADESFSFIRSEDSWQVEGRPDFPLSQAKVRNLAYAMVNISAEELLDENAADMSPYGLNEPATRITLWLKDGTEKQFAVGNRVLSGNSYYFSDNEGNSVYMMANATVLTLCQPLSYYHDDQLFEVDAATLTDIKLTQNGTLIYDIAYDPIEGKAKMVAPYTKTVDMEQFGELVLDALDQNLEVMDIIDTSGELAEYELDQPAYQVEIVSADGKTASFELGKESGMVRFVKLKGMDTVFSVPVEAFAFVKQSAKVFLEPYVKTYNIADLSRIEVTRPSGTKVMAVERKGEEEKFTIDGKSVEDAKFREAYRYLIGIYAEDFETAPSLDTAPELTIRYVFQNGDPDSIVAYYPLDARHYRTKVDGEWTADVVLSSTVDQALEILDQY